MNTMASTMHNPGMGNRAMSQTFTRLPGRAPPIEHVLGKIKEGQVKQLKVLKAHLKKKDRNQVTMALTNFKAKKAEEVAKEMIEDRIYRIKERNEWKNEKVAKRKAIIEAQKEAERKKLAEKEQEMMSPMQGNSAMMRTFNATVQHDTGGFFKMRHSLNMAKKENRTDERADEASPEDDEAGED